MLEDALVSQARKSANDHALEDGLGCSKLGSPKYYYAETNEPSHEVYNFHVIILVAQNIIERE